MSNSTTRIEILGQRDITSRIGIDRSMPALLSNYMSNGEWEAFCNVIDNALVPMQEIKDRVRGTMKMFCIVSFVSFFIVGGLMVTLTMTLRPGVYMVPIMFALGLVFILPGIIMFCRLKNATSEIEKIMQDVQRTLETESRKRSDLSFHMKTEQSLVLYNSSSGSRARTQTYYHIEAQVSGAAIPMGGNIPINSTTVATPVGSTFDSLAMNNVSGNNNGGKSAVERLKDLENVKHLISEQEYKNKKDSIIASL